MTACTQPGCTGSILDGYCNICGSPPAASDTASAAAGPTTPLTSAATPQPTTLGHASGACSRPGCPGTIIDGYCDVCGMQPGSGRAPSSPLPDSPVGTASSSDSASRTGDILDSAVSTSSRASSRLSSTALGSQRLGASGSKITHRIQSGSTRLRAARLGAGLTRVPPAPEVDASAAIMKHAVVPENKRVCPSCGAPVGRSRDGEPGRTEGFCARCRNPFSFTPKLQPGDLVAHQYEVAGCLAHGGLGWIYLARDKNVSDRWVVLKGLLNSGDADALAVAIAERQFLAQVEHPLIVEIYNFVSHDDAGYIVMEYVGGTSLKGILKARMRAAGGAYDPLPVDQALAYILEVLPAFQYLHDLNLAYCDFKPDNLIQVGDAVKLIDLGGVRRIDDHESAIYGTVGYQAPEVAQVGTSVASDIYTIGRTLVVLTMEFRGYQSRYLTSLPPVDETPLFQEHDSLYRLLAKACAPDPADRFASIDELRIQLLGVLREVVAEKTAGVAVTSAASVLFEAPMISSEALDWDELPSLRPDTTDSQAGWLANLGEGDAAARLRLLDAAPELTVEVQLHRATAALEIGRFDLVEQIVAKMLATDPWEWRAVWVAGLATLAGDDFVAAQSAFNAVYGQVPGELAPKLALALACERGEEGALAERLYLTCASTDANYVATAAFGLARLRAARGDIEGAVEALDLVPRTSRGYTESRRTRAQHLYQADLGLDSLADAMSGLDGVQLSPTDEAELTAHILEKALAVVTTKGPQKNITIGVHRADNDSLRDGLEQTYRRLARVAPSQSRRHDLVEQANAVRRWTLR